MGLPFLAVAARAMPKLEEGQKQSLKLILEEILRKQQPDGSWEWFAGAQTSPHQRKPDDGCRLDHPHGARRG